MAKAGSIKAGEAFIRLFADDTAFRRTLDGAAKRLRAFGTAVAAVGAGLAAVGTGTLGGLYAAGKTFSEVGDAIDKMNKRTGLSTEFISEMGFAAEQEGANIEELEKGFRKFQQTLGDAASGNKEAKDSLDALGLSIEALMGMSPDEQFYAVADALSKVENEAVRTEAAMAILGRGGSMLIPLLSKGSAGINELRRQARDLGLTFNDEAAASAAALNDALNALTRSMKAVWVWIGSAIAPSITALAEALTPIVAGISRWVQENRGLVVMLAQVAVGVTAVGAAVIGLGGAFIVAGLVLSGFSATVGLLGAAFAGVLWLLTSTTGFMIVMAASAAAVGTQFIDLGGVLDWLGQQFRTLKSIASDTITGIADALAYGDIQLAAEILWAGLEVTFLSGLSGLNKVWEGMKYAALSVMNVIVASLKSGIETATHFVISTAVSALRAAGLALTGFAAAISPALGSAVGAGMEKFNKSAGVFQVIEEARHQQKMVDIMMELARAQAELAAAKAEDIEAAEAAVAAAQARLDVLKAEAELRRKMVEDGKEQIDTSRKMAGLGAGAVESQREFGFASGSRRAIEAFRPDAIKGPIERTAKATEQLVDQGREQVSLLRSMAQGPVFT
jgi:hypothetical protein